jgi:hypothetical protein
LDSRFRGNKEARQKLFDHCFLAILNRRNNMSPEPKSLVTICRHDKPEQIERKISMLIRIYLDNHNPIIAQGVVEHINAILAHPGFIVDAGQRCRFRQLAAHWRCLAWIYNDATDTSQQAGLHLDSGSS